MKPLRFDLGKGHGSSQEKTLQSGERTAGEDQSVPTLRQLIKLFERSDHFLFTGECRLRHTSVVVVQSGDKVVCNRSRLVRAKN